MVTGAGPPFILPTVTNDSVETARRHAATSRALKERAAWLCAESQRLRALSICIRERLSPCSPPREPVQTDTRRIRVGAHVGPGRRDARAARTVVDLGPRRPASTRP
jgi:hypothetical protein